MLFTIPELLDIIITIVAASFIFNDLLKGVRPDDALGERMVLSAAIVTPAIVLHELGHKFTAMAFGLDATFHASYVWLGIGIVLKLVSFPFIFLVPAYVAITGGTVSQQAWTAFAGPAVNGVLALASFLALKLGKWSRTTTAVLYMSQTVNLFLFAFNLIPIPGFDGYSFWTGIF